MIYRFKILASQSGAGRITFQVAALALCIWLFIFFTSECAWSEYETWNASSWPEADLLFRGDRRWRGADGASSVDLGHGRFLWLFGDTFISPHGDHDGRVDSVIIRNSLAIQDGGDPSTASIRFYWGNITGTPRAFFTEPGQGWLWPGDGELIDGRLLVFFMKINLASNELGFEARGWTAALVDNPEDSPDSWRVDFLDVPDNSLDVLVGSGSVFVNGEYLYAYGASESVDHDIYLTRWSTVKAEHGDLSNPEWWCGRNTGWSRLDEKGITPQPVIHGGQNEFSVHLDPCTGKVIQIQTIGFGSSPAALRVADSLTGPWPEPRVFFTPPEAGRLDILIYAGKAHPELSGSDLAVTYLVNSLDEKTLLTDMNIYFPRFLKIRFNRRDTNCLSDIKER